MPMTFDRHEEVYFHEGEEYSSFEEAVMSILNITREGFKILSCAKCGSEKRMSSFHSGKIPCKYCGEDK